MDISAKADRFFELHQGAAAFVMPNPWDEGTAKIMTGMGFPALATTSSGMALARGRRDGTVTRDEVLAHARLICAATDLPVSADLENGFGHSPRDAAETIRLAGETGLVGGSIEDFSGDADDPIYEFEHAVERVAAAVEAAGALPFKFTLTARAENLLRGRNDMDDTIRRLQAYEAAGADVLYAPNLLDATAVKTICDAVNAPVNVLALRAGTDLTVDQISTAGGRRISLGGTLSVAAMGGLMNACRAILDSGDFSVARDLAAGSKGFNNFLSD